MMIEGGWVGLWAGIMASDGSIGGWARLTVISSLKFIPSVCPLALNSDLQQVSVVVMSANGAIRTHQWVEWFRAVDISHHRGPVSL